MSNSKAKYSKEEVLQGIKENYKREFGNLGDDERCCQRDGYFIVGFVRESIEKLSPDTNG